MDAQRIIELSNLVDQRLKLAEKYLIDSKTKIELKKAINEEAEIPGFETRPIKFGQFVEKEFVAMMTDIRKSTQIINSENGTVKMFLVFYAYSAVVANIVDKHHGTSTEFLGDGVINLFDTDNGRDEAFRNCIKASREIMFAREKILNPRFTQATLPTIDLGVGIDHGHTIVTRFGYKTDNDLKAFGKCVYNASKLCKGTNEIITSENSKSAWPVSPSGTLVFTPTIVTDGFLGYTAS